MTSTQISLVERLRRLLVSLAKARDLHGVGLKLLPVLANRGLALPAALFVWRTIRPLHRARGPFRLLVIEKWIFNEDILEVLKDTDEVQAFGVRRAIIKALALGILPRSVCGDDTYVSFDPAVEAAKMRYRALWRRMWPYLRWLGRYDGVVTGNWAYWAEREMATALEEAGTPFLVLHKEGIKPPERARLLRDLFHKTRGGFTGRRVLVYHEMERDHEVEGHISRPEQVRIVGMPRLDRLHAWRRRAAAGEVVARAERPTALFLAFIPNNFLPSYSGIASDLAWDQLCSGFYRAASRLAETQPGIDVIIRPRGYEIAEVETLLDRGGARPANVRIVADGELMPLIQASWVVCGHNTTGVIEALAAGKPVVVPHFGEAIDPRYSGYIVEHGAAVEHAWSAEDLVARLTFHCAAPAPVPDELDPAVIAELAKWSGNPDGRASARALRALIEELAIGAVAARKVL